MEILEGFGVASGDMDGGAALVGINERNGREMEIVKTYLFDGDNRMGSYGRHGRWR